MKGVSSHGRADPASRRILFFSLVLLTTFGAMSLLSGVFQEGGVTPLELALLLLYAILILWISASFWTAAIGFVRLLAREEEPPPSARAVGSTPGAGFKTALVMPVYNEDPERVFAGLRAIDRSLQETGQAEGFEIFVLSDTRDPDIWVEEELQ
ncbi:MAG: glucans biosynthesis glucosyltransferase MdoH, partial [Gammaproteobacteria bacterium]|nr:glucans biosynthesis glucosyltransferase MdoH [Gammaproteobacteria bacterium]